MANLVLKRDNYGDDYELIYVKGSATLDDGNLVVATTLSTDSFEEGVYTATQATANTASSLAMIVAEEYYEDANGNRINITDPTDITYRSGTIIRAIRPAVGRRFAISNSAVGSGTPAVGQFLVPTANDFEFTAATTLADDINFALRVEAINENISFKGNTPIVGVEAIVVRNNLV